MSTCARRPADLRAQAICLRLFSAHYAEDGVAALQLRQWADHLDDEAQSLEQCDLRPPIRKLDQSSMHQHDGDWLPAAN